MSAADRPKVFLDARSNRAREILADSEVEIVEQPEGADLLWMRRGFEAFQQRLEPDQLLNHVQGELAMVDKGEMTTHLQARDACLEADGLRLASFYPETFRMYLHEDRERFFEKLAREGGPDGPWILKPTDLSKGRGIYVLSKPEQFESLRLYYQGGRIDPSAAARRPPRHILQRYIRDILLLDGRKSELRIYWLLACLDPLLVLMYREGTTRLTAARFKLDDFDNALIHITNTYRQKRHPDFVPGTELKWDFARLQTHVSEELGAAPDYVEAVLKPALRERLAWAMRATRPRLGRAGERGLPFALLGADFILDQQLRPWLTELQRGPGLSYNDPIKARVVPEMLREAVRIVLEIQRRRREGRDLRGLESVQGFEWVIDEGGAGPV